VLIPAQHGPTAPSATSQRIQLVLIGLSAGGIEALIPLLDSLPRDFRFPIVIVVHLHPDYKSVMVRLLTQRTGRHVKAAANGDLESGVVYVAPPNQHVTFVNGQMRLVHSAPVHHVRPSIDVLFESAARDTSLHVVAVLLSGAGCDGAVGMTVVKAAGGVTIAQLPDTALFPSMPRSAIATGCVDFVLPSSKIAELLKDLAA
jgi:two-component system chemotaxis response regulator CheB